MNKYTGAISSVLVAGTLVFANCSSIDVNKLAKQQGLTVTPSPLEVYGQEVPFNMEAALPAKSMKEGYTYDIMLQYAPQNGEPVAAGTVSFKGDDYKDVKNAPIVNKALSFPYSDGLGNGQLQFLGRATKVKNGKVKETNKGAYMALPNGMGQGLITTSTLIKAPLTVVYADHGYNTGEEYEPVNFEFFFQVGSSKLTKQQLKGQQAKDMEAYIAAKNPTRTVAIVGTHSPEGPTSINTRLANDRPVAVEKFYKDIQKKTKAEGGDINFVIKPVVDNWAQFIELLKTTNALTDAQKDEVMSIINGPGDFVSQQLKLQTLPYYGKMFKAIYPPLRNAKTEILKIIPKPTEAQMAALAEGIANGTISQDSLKNIQMMYVASISDDLAKKEAYYKTAVKMEDSAVAYNNLGATYMAMAAAANFVGDAGNGKAMDLVKQAKQQFEAAIRKGDLAEAYVNMASVELIMGNIPAAQGYMNKAEGMNLSASAKEGLNAEKGYMAFRRGDYDQAIQDFSAAGKVTSAVYDKALSYLLKTSKSGGKDFGMAEAAFNDAMATNANNPWAFYGAAITQARKGNANGVMDYLAKAVKLDKNLAAKAASDLEFRAYWADAAFSSIVK